MNFVRRAQLVFGIGKTRGWGSAMQRVSTPAGCDAKSRHGLWLQRWIVAAKRNCSALKAHMPTSTGRASGRRRVLHSAVGNAPGHVAFISAKESLWTK